MTELQQTLSLGDSLVSPTQLQVSKEVAMMIGTYGVKCSGLSEKSVLDGLLVRMLKDSSAWHSTMCRLIWKVQAMKSGRLFFLLHLKTLTTEEIESGLSADLWATPNVMDHLPQRSEEALKNLAEGHRKGRKRPSNLREQVDPKTMAMWPTPARSDGERGNHMTKIEWRNGRCYRESLTTGTKFGATLNAAVANPMFPTPKATDYKGSVTPERAAERAKESKRGVDLSEDVVRKMYPTPLVSDADQYSSNPEYAKNRAKKAKTLSVDIGASGEKTEQGSYGKLNPDWVEALMGYPVGYTDLEVDEVGELSRWVGNPDDSNKPRVTDKTEGRTARLKQLGNSIVPQVARELFRQIRISEDEI